MDQGRCHWRLSWVQLCIAPVASVVLWGAAGGASAACPGETQMEMNECAGIAYKEADKSLNQIYKKLERTPDLVAAQRAWITFRDAECEYQASAYEGGSMQPMVYANCLQSLTEDRTEQLEQALQGQ